MEIESPAFKNNGNIPSKYTCDGEDINPPLKISKVPLEAKSLVLIVEDPDAPGRSFLHWLLWNIPPETKEIQESNMPERAVQGITDFGKKGWGGPCPPKNVGLHHYFFRLYALDRVLDIVPSASFTEVKEAIEGHILDKAELVGIYKR
ncbi:YbhB/YbcL family Raf kinase inhibitor-like protein [bacterium]|nr:YbhB/YbcL family Raf kinase inhibitor-like protein [bacterium]